MLTEYPRSSNRSHVFFRLTLLKNGKTSGFLDALTIPRTTSYSFWAGAFTTDLKTSGSKSLVLLRKSPDNPSQQVRALALRSQLMALFNALDQTVNSRREKGFETVRQELLVGRGRLETAAMRTTIADMRAEEEQLLGMREK
jgi:hypothetical protein